ncbi:EexN family lipoprotein [Sphingopyxis alaskensis]|uniref:EexN family lipoprotein n=2 Tax=Sphingopyxis alaskensis TaxID=117207 RepID=Q1GPX4_SPHAL|nr:EexN family lipoprotein [Sphingopyxis alaskensis]ABF54298.1 hypothetical protein Sala_2592 [Sphingopyxis alaskensis RB2256]
MREAGSHMALNPKNGTTGRKMMTKKKLILTVLTGPFALAACAQSAPRSSEYFAEHLDEARQIVAGCRDGTVRGEECANAGLAIEEADAKARFRRFRGRD